jgi:hypothetical protein
VFKLPDAELLDGELPLFRLELFVLAERSFVVLIDELELFIRLSDPLWLVAAEPVPVLVVSVAPMSPVSFLAQPANNPRHAIINANFFIIQNSFA